MLLTSVAASATGNSVRIGAIQRELDTYLQKQLRTETSGGTYADTRATFYDRLQQIYGDPNSDSALSAIYNTFTNSIQSLVTSPDPAAARGLVLSNAQVLAQTLNGMTLRPRSRCGPTPRTASRRRSRPPTTR